MNTSLASKVVLITGGTGSLGQTLVRCLMRGDAGKPKRVIVFSRDEAKQHYLRSSWQQQRLVTGEDVYRDLLEGVQFIIGDVRNQESIKAALHGVDVVFNAAAMKQVPTCEYFPYEAVETNVTGAANLARAVRDSPSVNLVVGVSTDKACKPVNAMGMTKALQERTLIATNLHVPHARFLCVRYGNVISSRGSVIPLFRQQVENGGPVTVTMGAMTRFMLGLERAVETILAAVQTGRRGEIYVPRVSSASVIDIARAVVGDRDIPIKEIGLRPGEKIHEILVSDEESYRTVERGDYYVVQPYLPELEPLAVHERVIDGEFSSEHAQVKGEALQRLLSGVDFIDHGLGFTSGKVA